MADLQLASRGAHETAERPALVCRNRRIRARERVRADYVKKRKSFRELKSAICFRTTV
jgi:hypothetical protein